MEGNSSLILTMDDFYLEPNFLPYGLFACPDCHIDTTYIVRHTKWQYIAEFMCENPLCSRWSKKWYKCRLCTKKNKCFNKASDHLRNTITHNNRLAAFKLLKPSEYIEREDRFTTPILDMERRSNLFAAFAVAIADRRSLIGESQVQDFDSSWLDDAFSVPFDRDDDDDNDYESDELSSDVVSEESHLPPATVPEWKSQLVTNSQELVRGNDLSPYFSVEEEETPIKGHIRRPWNAQYHEYNLQFPGGGPRLLVAKTVVGNATSKTTGIVYPKNALWCVLLSKISSELSLIGQEILVGLMDHMRRETPDDFLPLPVPKKHCELRRKFISGRNSIPELLPRPIPIKMLEDGFVYVSIRDILQYHLAHGQSLDPLLDLEYSERPKVRTLHGSSPRGKELLSLTVQGNQVVRAKSSHGPVKIPLSKFPTEILLWSDGFDPNYRKDNRGSAHIVFVSIGTPQDDYHGGRNTYPVSIGPANGDLTIVSKRIAEELTEMFKDEPDMNVYFDSISKKELQILGLVYCLLQDRPERCHWLCLAHGNGRYSGRFGWSADLSQKQVLAFLPSCKECNDFRMKNKVRECESCADWFMSRVHFKVPEDFPTVFTKRCDMEDTDGSEVADVNPSPDDETPRPPPLDPRVKGTHLPCSQLTVDKLKLACIDSFDMVRLGKWQKKEGRSYLDTHGISPDYCSQICDTAERIKKFGNQEPMPELPATWSIPGVDICHHIDVPMHLCFLGITKALFSDLVSGWLKSKKKSTSFKEKSKPLLVQIRKLSLSWCKIECTFGGFVSENWVAYCRICKYICGLFPNLVIKDVEYKDPPGVPLSQYKFQQKKAWLLARTINGINKSSKKQEVDEAFSKYLSLPAGTQLPAIVKPTVSSASPNVVNHMVISWNVCMSRIMSLDRNPREDQVNDIERHIKLFLSSVNEFDKSRVEAEEAKRRKQQNNSGNSLDNKRRKKEGQPIPPVWRRKPNFLGLLNIPESVRHLGPIRVLTELDLKGEASIKHIKKHIKQGLNGNWAYNAMIGYYRERSFKYVLKDCLVDIGDTGRDESSSEPEPMLEVTTKLVGSLRVETSLEEEFYEACQMNSGSSDDEDKDVSEGTKKRYKNYQTFIRMNVAAESLHGDVPISGMVANGRFYLVVKNKEGHSVLEIRPRKWNEEVCGANYHTWETVPAVGVSSNRKPIVRKMLLESEESFLLLPAIPKDPENRGGSSFYLISSEWRELSKSKDAEGRFVLQLPTIPGASY